jgi:hypothetical protein
MASSATSQFGLFLFAASIGTLLLTMAPQFGTGKFDIYNLSRTFFYQKIEALECLTLSGPRSQTPFGTKQCEADEEYCGTVLCQKIKSNFRKVAFGNKSFRDDIQTFYSNV